MSKLPWMQFYPSDWLLDTQLLSPSARGIWIDIICLLWRVHPRGRMSQSVAVWARLLRCSEEVCNAAVTELHHYDICTVIYECNCDVTLVSRRIENDERRRNNNRLRVAKHRVTQSGNASVTHHVTGIYQNHISESEVRSQNHISESEVRIKSKDKKRVTATTASRGAGKSVATWDAYSKAYVDRYKVEPVRNAQTNALLTKLVDKLGAEEAPQVAAFYLLHNGQFYVSKRHPANLLVQDAEGLRTQWKTGIRATTLEARNAEVKDNIVGQVDRVMAMLKKEDMV